MWVKYGELIQGGDILNPQMIVLLSNVWISTLYPWAFFCLFPSVSHFLWSGDILFMDSPILGYTKHCRSQSATATPSNLWGLLKRTGHSASSTGERPTSRNVTPWFSIGYFTVGELSSPLLGEVLGLRWRIRSGSEGHHQTSPSLCSSPSLFHSYCPPRKRTPLAAP